MRRMLTAGLAILMASVLLPGTAQANDVAVVTQVVLGTRSITAAALTTPLAATVIQSLPTTGVLAVTVTETAVAGANWSITGRLCGPNGGGTAADCGTHPDKIVVATATSNTIPGVNASISGTAVTATLGGGTLTPAGTQNLQQVRTIYTNTLQDTNTLYTGSYLSTSNITLTPPAATAVGTYTGYLVVTLV